MKITTYPILTILSLAVSSKLIALTIFSDPLIAGGDFLHYSSIAESLSVGGGFGVLYVAPLWPLMLTGVYVVGFSPVAGAIFLQVLFGAGIALVVYCLARFLLNVRVAVIAGSVAAVWPTTFFALVVPGTTTLLYSMLLLAGVCALLYSTKHNPIVGGSTSGVLFALAALTDAIGLYIPVAIIVWVIVLFAWEGIIMKRVKQSTVQLLYSSIVLIIFFVLTITPWALRNAAVFEGQVTDRPIIVKQIEMDALFDKVHRVSIVETFTGANWKQGVYGVSTLLFVPFGLPLLDAYTERSYKQIVHDIVIGNAPALSANEYRALFGKIIVSFLQGGMLLFAGVGAWLLRTRVTLLLAALMSYTAFAAVGVGALSNFKGISPLSEFFVPFIFAAIPFAAMGVVTSIVANKEKLELTVEKSLK